MATKFDDLLRDIEAETQAAGTEAVAALERLRAHYAVAREIAEIRIAKGLTQDKLAELSGVQQSEISKIENGRANPTLDTLTALGRPLGASVHFARNVPIPPPAGGDANRPGGPGPR